MQADASIKVLAPAKKVFANKRGTRARPRLTFFKTLILIRVHPKDDDPVYLQLQLPKDQDQIHAVL